MTRLSRIALPGYAVCAWLMLFPLVDALLLTFPLTPSLDRWRYSGAVVLSRSLMTPCLGLVLAFALAIALDHERMQRAIKVVSGAMTAMIVLVTGVFLKDSIGLGGRAAPASGLAAPFGAGWALSLMKLLFFILVLALLTGAAGTERGSASAGVVSSRQR
jgi:hypothetical protein